MNKINIFEKLKNKALNEKLLRIGDTVKIGIKIIEGEKDRIQYFQGIVINKNRSVNNCTITLRKIFQNIGVERIFPLNSPQINSIEILKSSSPKRAKLFYLRNRIGKAANRIK